MVEPTGNGTSCMTRAAISSRGLALSDRMEESNCTGRIVPDGIASCASNELETNSKPVAINVLINTPLSGSGSSGTFPKLGRGSGKLISVSLLFELFLALQAKLRPWQCQQPASRNVVAAIHAHSERSVVNSAKRGFDAAQNCSSLTALLEQCLFRHAADTQVSGILSAVDLQRPCFFFKLLQRPQDFQALIFKVLPELFDFYLFHFLSRVSFSFSVVFSGDPSIAI